MPELPEVETVRAGLERHVVGRTIVEVDVRHPRSVRRHIGGATDLARRLTGRTIASARRRGKYLWLPLDDGGSCLTGHLGMSGQLLVRDSRAPAEKHLHVVLSFAGGGPQLRFVDQRTFGHLMLDELVATPDLPGDTVPAQIAHIARDPLDAAFDERRFLDRLAVRRTALKRALLDQSLLSGIGNIYADEALWRAKLSGERAADALPRRRARHLLAEVRSVLTDALAAGGTSFDALYVNVNGQSGYFDRSLAVYGREGQPCLRCGRAVRRAPFMNRSSFSCSWCQRRPATPVRRLAT